MNTRFRLHSVSTDASPRRGFVRLTGRLQLGGEQREIWYEVADELAAGFSSTADPWLIVLLPLALEHGGVIESALPGDPLLLENLQAVMAIWRDWYPKLKPVTITAPAGPAQASPSPKSGVFFTGGVDSWFTVLRRTPSAKTPQVGFFDDLITVEGFDIAVDNREEHDRLQARLRPAADALGKRLVTVGTNLREHRSYWQRRWGPLTHGAGLASVGLALGHRFRSIAAGSTFAYGKLVPWGSHPMVDPLFSTTATRFIHDGAHAGRAAKLRTIAQFPLAVENLHVCWKTQSSTNCGRCIKCVRTLATLEVLGVAARNRTFTEPFSMDLLARCYVGQPAVRVLLEEVGALAAELGRRDIVAAIDRSLRTTRLLRPAVHLANTLHDWALLWRVGAAMKSTLLRDRPAA
jgi:hypothetical protein